MATAAKTVIVAHVVVEYPVGESDVAAILEIDDRVDGFNQGRTQFSAGQDAFLLLFKPVGFSVYLAAATSGILTEQVATADKSIEEVVVFPNEDSANLNYPVDKDFTTQWIGTPPDGSGGAAAQITLQGKHTIILPARKIDTITNLPIPEYRIGIAKVTYLATADVYKLSGVEDGVTSVLCFFVLKKD